ncbi:MAG: hypothetical protein A3F82_00955 [Deltaproteobacteria bacterium RIFCSPLOWO2_12_FULL_44_12]|nr:MAG: hypothetical protein A2712_04000 [Deltaproteobacteria bacterium RIFCSPHIGHO2_01_FULL_43_49]OGQ16348.1 MAG: hypothetical protein A3D22_01970 [Deltaproteobacteria bacterium RIFCSPHIGHO2_02_FULL_44_53]OGQ29309.1 MAG: hypothetical protein A3D98_05755 [Deltaproteobacteria bacterium RIFCSPHIGHO2_12_FULL_44_21]OGQ32866.1 MAG: hypothetical protein A2979_09900 [Deltaproteobacteria bacterium RIFCSPLOWO2_01_FULL_45_74]OGQ41967.1 MAG: hypothetical protein A3I70_09685 [Deltaproteobacteria bacterium 
MALKTQKGLFADKATLILRALLKNPSKNWVVRDLVRECRVSLGLVSKTIGFLNELGYVRVERGRTGYINVVNLKAILSDWVYHYDFSLNAVFSLYSPDKNALPKLKAFLIKKGLAESYALTLHSGANLLTNYVSDENSYLYLASESFHKIVREIQDRLGFKQLRHGGNVHLIQPYYKNSAFYDCRTIRQFRVVSDLQLYLDLYHFAPRGREHAEHLKKLLEKEKSFP